MPSSPNAAFCRAAESLYARLLVFRRLAAAAGEREDDEVTLQRRELWESADEQALQEFEVARHALNGAVPLPFGERCPGNASAHFLDPDPSAAASARPSC